MVMMTKEMTMILFGGVLGNPWVGFVQGYLREHCPVATTALGGLIQVLLLLVVDLVLVTVMMTVMMHRVGKRGQHHLMMSSFLFDVRVYQIYHFFVCQCEDQIEQLLHYWCKPNLMNKWLRSSYSTTPKKMNNWASPLEEQLLWYIPLKNTHLYFRHSLFCSGFGLNTIVSLDPSKAAGKSA